ncbi:MAG: acyl-CoA dehydrogenase [Legionellaceae bacterium]|nr:acyl-CoA dehydrogenase [Legionellaceae bacterium]
MLSIAAPLIIFIYSCVLISKKSSALIWLISYLIFGLLLYKYNLASLLVESLVFFILAFSVFISIKPLRIKFLTGFIYKVVERTMPNMSSTEREALEAGSVSLEGDIFSGCLDFNKLYAAKAYKLRKDEQLFLDGQVNELCRMLDDWDITHNKIDLPVEVWDYIKNNGFLGMIIPKKYGGLEFSATAQMQVLVKIYSSCITAATTVSVPNSLGPAELLLKYGTDSQKDYYLPRLANGKEIPCFALTGPNAGSDAASIPDRGVVCTKTIDGKKVLGMKLTWDKRYITLCPVATIIGLAFRLFDPENLLGKGEDLGITCALIPADTPGVIKGRRHFPLNVAFMNGPTQGDKVFVPIDCIIGGAEMAGNGWRMLMECLSVGRAISLPSGASGASKAAALATGAYARIRQQFHQPIANFEGIEEPLARIAGNTYILDSSLSMITADIDNGAQPPVAGAIVKYNTTELSRQIACDAMDIHGGKGICLGPNNYLGRGFQSCPISITVEGANILTRSLIIFGQGAIRCHPYVFDEMESVRNKDKEAFDKAFSGHFKFAIANLFNSVFFSWSNAFGIRVPKGPLSRYQQLLQLYSTALASFSDVAMLLLGSKLKRMEKLSARLGDVLSKLYLMSSVLQRYHQDGQPVEDIPLVSWCCENLLHECEQAIYGVIVNFPIRWMRMVLRLIYLPYGTLRKKPSDKLGQQLAHLLTTQCSTRKRITRNIFHEDIMTCPIGRVEAAFEKVCKVTELERKVMHAVKDGKIKSLRFIDQIEEAHQLKIVTNKQYVELKDAEQARQYVIAVDNFSFAELLNNVEHPLTKDKNTTK